MLKLGNRPLAGYFKTSLQGEKENGWLSSQAIHFYLSRIQFLVSPNGKDFSIIDAVVVTKRIIFVNGRREEPPRVEIIGIDLAAFNDQIGFNK